MTFRDHFSGHAAAYARWRPGYPSELFEWLASLGGRRRTAWDCATGNGQAAGALASFLGRVVATDASLAQVARAVGYPGVSYHVAEATSSGLAPGSIDLVTVAQALHWFDLEPFLAEVRRVLAPGGALVAWTYSFFRVEPAIDELMAEFAETTVGAFWPAERRHVDAGYRTLTLDLEPIEAPGFVMRERWDLDQLLAYIGTWSAVRRFRHSRGFDPVSDLAATLEPVWPRPAAAREIRWHLTVLAGRP